MICDYCDDIGVYTEVTKPYFKYIKQRKIIDRDCCNDCRDFKQREVMLLKYGVTSAVQLDEVKSKINKVLKLDFSNVIEYFNNSNCTLKSTASDYKDNTSKLSFICNNHIELGIQYKSWASIQNKNKEICTQCNIENRTIKLRKCFSEITVAFSKKGYDLLPNQQYLNSTTKLNYVCSKHPEYIQETTFGNLSTANHNCKYCYRESTSGENAMFWKGGVTDEVRMARNNGDNRRWRKSVFERDNYTCQCCGVRGGKLNVHHIENFADNKELRYSMSNGITLCENHHLLKYEESFHRIYGSSDNDIHQLQEYFDDTRYLLGLPPIDIIEDIIYKDYIFDN